MSRHDVVQQTDMLYRCTICGGLSLSRASFDILKCKGDRDDDHEVKGTPPPSTFVRGSVEPAFPALGDIWFDTGSNHIWVWSEDDTGVRGMWRDPDGAIRPGQAQFAGTGVHLRVQTYSNSLMVTRELLEQGGDDVVKTAKKNVEDGLKKYMGENDAIRVGPIRVDLKPEPGQAITIFTARAQGRPIPTELLITSMRGPKPFTP